MDLWFKHKQFQGLGYYDDYKMVRFTYKSEYRRADVYTLETNSWKKIPLDVCDDREIIHIPFNPGTALNGFIYWLVEYRFNGGLFLIRCFNLDFDFKKDKFTKLPLPPESFFNISAYLKETLAFFARC